MTVALGPLVTGPGGGLVSFEVQEQCQELGRLPVCTVLFDQKLKNSTLVLRFGRFGHGKFEPNPDIAGIGVRAQALVLLPFSHLLTA